MVWNTYMNFSIKKNKIKEEDYLMIEAYGPQALPTPKNPKTQNQTKLASHCLSLCLLSKTLRVGVHVFDA